jgi:multicomponent Na+:H+ antiporter subunit D
MIGAPPVAGFVTKWYLLNGAWDAGAVGIIVVLLASTLLNAAYFAPVVYRAFFGDPAPAHDPTTQGEAPWTMVVPLSVTAGISVVLGFYPDFFLGLVRIILP